MSKMTKGADFPLHASVTVEESSSMVTSKKLPFVVRIRNSR